MLDPSTYYTTHRYYEQKQAEALRGVSSGDSGHPWGREEGTGHQEPTAQHAHRPHVLTQTALSLYLYKKTFEEYIRNKMRPQVLSPVYSLRKLNPGLKTSGDAASTALKAGATTNAHTEPRDSSSVSAAAPGPGTLCQAEDQSTALKNTAAAAAKSLQSCPTLCDPIDGSPPGSPVPGILQARTLEWAAISFSNA